MNSNIQKPRGTRDIYGQDLSRFNQLIQIIRSLFTSYGYTEIKTPIFEHINVFKNNDETLLEANKELFLLQSRTSPEPEYVLRPENTASLVRALVENKIMNRQIQHPLMYFYEGSYFRYERPQQGRLREFTQMGVEKINSTNPKDDLENILLIHQLQSLLNLNLTLKLNYMGSAESKQRWNDHLKDYFKKHKNQLSEISQTRIDKNPFRILDDKKDSQLEIVKKAPPIDSFLSPQELDSLEDLKNQLSLLKIKAHWDPTLVRGIDYYTGLIYEWVDPVDNLTIIAGGRYDHLFERFNHPPVPCLGLAIGLDRLKMILERDNKYQWNPSPKLLYLYPTEYSPDYTNKILSIRKHLTLNHPYVRCIVSHEILSPLKHSKLAYKYSDHPILKGIGKEPIDTSEISRLINEI